MKEIIFIRHGQSEWQSGITKDRNSNLTQVGIEQAQALGSYLRKYIDIKSYQIISSPLKRSLQTCDHALYVTDNENKIVDSDFQEASFHVRGGLTLPHDFYPTFNSKVSSEYKQFKSKIRLALNRVISQNDKTIIFSHGGVIKTALRIHCGSDSFCTEIDNCSITHFVFKDNFWLLYRVNQKCI
ncbi:MAG: putative phosphoglycerate mutase [Proteobacteria bacterium]|nr:putative phosphoglycerate mutase [Pseudomonadota bacterium]